MTTFCAPVSKEQLNRESNLGAMRELFNGNTVKDVDGKSRNVGKIIKETYGDVHEGLGTKMFEEIVWRSTYKPALDHYEGFNDGDFRRIAKEITREAKKLSNPKLNILERLFGVKRGVMQKFAITNWMNKHINLATNYERTKYNHYLSAHMGISEILRAEILSRKGQSRWLPGIKSASDLRKLENKISLELQNPESNAKWNKIEALREEIMKTLEEGGGPVLEEFRQYLETKPKKFVNGNVDMGDGKKGFVLNASGQRFSRNIELAGELARQSLNDLGGVLINGIENHMKVIRMAFLHSPSKDKNYHLTKVGQRVKSYEKYLNDEIKAIKKGIKRGDYFPHYLLETFVKIEDIMREAEENNYKDAEGSLSKLEGVFSNVRQNLGTPKAAHHRSRVPYETYMKNPLGVLRKYAMDAIAFNRVNYVKNTYMQGIQKLPKDPRIQKVLTDYIDDMFTLAERGYQDRDPWVNKTVRLLTGYQFLSKIGFGVATAARNTLSGMYYLQAMGKRSFTDYLTGWNREENRAIRTAIRESEQEQGFKFEDMASPLFLEGLLPTEGLNVRDVDIKQDLNGDFKLSYNDGKAWRAVDSALTRVTGYGAVLQRVTENFLRKHMYRHSFMTKYKELTKHGATENEAMKLSKQWALNIVNKFAFEYAAHQKAPVTGGTTHGLGAVGQVAAQFFHYPFSFLQLQSDILRKSKDAAFSRQWDSPDLFVPLKFASLYAFTTLASGFFNLDLHRIMENDSVDRIKDLIDVVQGEDEIKGRGYLGPTAGDLFFWASALDWMELPDNAITDLVVGYNNAYKLTDEQKHTRAMATINVQLSKLINRDWKALHNGTGWDVMMHDFGLYPRAWTREMREKFPLKMLPWETTKKGKPAPFAPPPMPVPSISPKKKQKSEYGDILKSIDAVQASQKIKSRLNLR